MDTLRIIITGGTFDKVYDPQAGTLTFQNSHVPEIIEVARLSFPVELEIVQLMDSLDMRDACRQRIVEACRAAPEDRLVITHGTDTMAETARLLHAAAIPKIIVLTGAMVPFAFSRSDALFNFGAAVLAAQTQPPGVYVAMNGRLWSGENVIKNRKTGLFSGRTVG